MDYGKLTEADYENIWLRIKDRSLKLVLGMVGAVGIGGFAAGYQWANMKLDDHVEKHLAQYLKGDTFKDLVGKALVTGTGELRAERLGAEKTLRDLQERAAALKDIGVLVQDNQLSVTGPDGKAFRIERGIVDKNGKVTFAKPYPKPPIVLVDASYDSFNTELRSRHSYDLVANRPPSAAFVVVPASEIGFDLKARYIRSGVNWIAIGW